MAFEDQTDEDFFDKLVDDEFTVSGSEKLSGDLSSLSLVDGELVSDVDDRKVTELAVNEVANEPELPAAGRPLESSCAIGDSDEYSHTVAKDGGVLGTSLKEVQWSAFRIENLQSEADFLVEGSGGPIINSEENGNLYSSFIEKPDLGSSKFVESSQQNFDSNFYGADSEQTAIDSTTFTETSQQQPVDSQLNGSGNQQVADNNDPANWENLYPGWKYDYSSGQWYQVVGYDKTLNSSSDKYEELSQDSGLVTGDGVGSYLQQTNHSFSEIAEESSKIVTSQQNFQYPPNMVFDPQYPGWYYDTITQQWYALESYTQNSAETTVNGGQDQLSQSFVDSGRFSGQVNYAYSQRNERQAVEMHVGQDWGTSTGNFACGDWDASKSTFAPQNKLNESFSNSNHFASFNENKQTGSFYSSWDGVNYVNQRTDFMTSEAALNNGYARNSAFTGSQGFVPIGTNYQYSEQKLQPGLNTQSISSGFSQSRYLSSEERSSAGRPPHALVAFGFGGKLIVVEDGSIKVAKMDYGSQGAVNATISIFNLMDVVGDKDDSSIVASQSSFCYFQSLCKFPGPLVGGSAATKDVNKWIDERIISSETYMDFHKAKLLNLLLSLLKIVCQHYGKLRSSFGADPSHEETEGPEASVARLFASARKDGGRLGDYASVAYCLRNFPSESQLRAAAVDVQNLLISGRRKEALQRAQEGYLWGPALVLAAQLGDKFYVETVKRMAHQQFISGSPLRTLCLLIAGQPADVFSADITANNISTAANIYQQTAQIPSNGMLDSWEENLAVITANRTRDDELVLTHLGDCLWRERGEVTAAHTCYLVAEKDFESYSGSARMCLIGADHLKCPRTYASPESIQMTEFYEYAKVLGNSQFILLPLQPYKLIYAFMLAEVGKVSDSLRYCQASLKLLRNCGRAPEVETWKSYFTSLEERLKTHQQGGYSTNLASSKFVGKLFNSLDKSIKGMIGAPPPSLPPLPNGEGKESYSSAPKVATNQSTMSIASLMPSASVEAISQWADAGNRISMHNRSVSEPDFGRSAKQESGFLDSQNKASGGPSRFGRFGSQIFQKTVGWVSRARPDREAKLGEKNKFYYDEKLKRWVEEGAESPAEDPALPPPPTGATFQNSTPDYNINNAFKSQTVGASGGSEDRNSAMPPIPPSTNQFSARARMGVRSRYVDTFNKGSDSGSTKSSQSYSVPSIKPAVPATFFIPTASPNSDEQTNLEHRKGADVSTDEEPSTSTYAPTELSFASPSTSSSLMHRFPSMDNIVAPSTSVGSVSYRPRAASWDGFQFNPSEHVGNGTSGPFPFKPHHDASQLRSNSSSQHLNSSGLRDDLHEVDL